MQKIKSIRVVAIFICFATILTVSAVTSFAEKNDLINLFQADTSVAGAIDANNQLVEHNEYQTSDYIAVEKGDILYFGAAFMQQRNHLALQDSDKKGIGLVNVSQLTIHEEMGYGYAIYSYTVPEAVAYVRVIAQRGVYLDGSELVTLNQPFSTQDYCELFNIQRTTNHALSGKQVLFMGDNICYGVNDLPSYRMPNRGWAGRLELQTGLVATNVSTNGATITENRSTSWVGSQYLPLQDRDYDMIVIQGGFYDAYRSSTVGTASALDADAEVLRANTESFIGGLQWMLYDIHRIWPNAQIYVMSNYATYGVMKGLCQNMDPYFSTAQRLCAKLDYVSWIELNRNKELNETLDSESTTYLTDYINPNSAGYDIITPYILAELEKRNSAPEQSTTQETTAAPEDTSVETTTETTASQEVETLPPEQQTNAPSAEPKKGGCGSTLSAIPSVIILTSLLGIAIQKKKKQD